MTKLSILCASFNNTENQLRVFIHSILEQSFKEYTCYILQDGPDEKTELLCKSINDERIVYEPSKIRNGKWGFPNRNKKLFEIKSEYVCFQSADNYVVPKAYEYLITTLENEKADIVLTNVLHNYANINSFNRDGSQDKNKLSPPYNVLDSMLGLNKIDISNFVIKTKLAQEVGGFNLNLPERLQPGADGFFIEAVIAKYGSQLKALKINNCLMVHN